MQETKFLKRTSVTKTTNIDLEQIIMKIVNCNDSETFPITESQIEGICFSVRSILLSQPMLIEISPPIAVCGDTHGQFKDLLNIFKNIGEPG